ncbi:MAG: tripartite tricarboxylate transporter substrate binding protein [Pseudomonadota bacterium]
MKSFNAVVRMLTVGVLMAITGSVAAQQPYPVKPIRFIVPFPPGGSTDPMARMAAGKLAENWGVPVVVDNRPGGSTIIGTEAVAKAPPDGYTILLAGIPLVTGISLYPSIPYNAIKDFAPIATIARSEFVLVLHPSVAANNLREFMALAKSRPEQLDYGSSGTGGSLHLAAELFNVMVGSKMQHIPYKGSGPLISDLIGGQVKLSFQTPIATISHIKSGRLKAIAVTGKNRNSALPQVPTFTEAGLSGFDVNIWYGIVAPAGTPKGVIDKMSGEMAQILVMPDIREYLARQGMEPFISTPDQVTALIRADIAKYAKIIKTANIKLQ